MSRVPFPPSGRLITGLRRWAARFDPEPVR